MSSIIKVDTIQNQSGANIISESANTITVGASGDTVTIPSGGTFDMSSGTMTLNSTMKMVPAFEAYLGSDQTISDNVPTKVQCGSEVYDTNSAYDNSTNYRFTVPTGLGGKYYFYGGIKGQCSSADTILFMSTYIYLNGAQARRNEWFHASTGLTIIGVGINQVLDLSAGDYVELYGQVDVTSGTPRFDAGGTGGATYFGGYRIIGA